VALLQTEVNISFYEQSVYRLWRLTDNIEVNEITPDRLGADLTLVDACVPFLCPFDLQRPLFVVSVMICLEPLVARVCIAPYCQDVDVSMPDP
jgi:hypothetical protein